MARRWWVQRKKLQRLGVQTTFFGLLGLLVAGLASVVETYLPWHIPHFVDQPAIESLLTILSSSMLAVTTFSLGIMTSAYGAASNSVTPRATRLLLADTTTQSVLSVFMGSFVFSLVSLVMLRFSMYGERGRVVLLLVTIAVLIAVVAALLRWIHYLTQFGRMGDSISRVEKAARHALQQHVQMPFLGGQAWHPGLLPQPSWHAIPAHAVGCVQHIDMPALQALAEQLQQRIYVAAPAGRHVFTDTPVLWLQPAAHACQAPNGAQLQALREAVVIGHERDFAQDPRFGLVVLCEIASRALSPATNDPGTALDIIARTTRLLSAWAPDITTAQIQALSAPPTYPLVYVPPLRSSDLLDDAFMLVARDGAGLIEIQLRLHKSLAALARLGDAEFQAAVHDQARLALARASQAMAQPEDLQRLNTLVRSAGLLHPKRRSAADS